MFRRVIPRLTSFTASAISGSAAVHDADLAVHFLQRIPSWAETTSTGAPAPGSVSAKLMKARLAESAPPSVVKAVEIAAAVDINIASLRDVLKTDAAFTRVHLTATGDSPNVSVNSGRVTLYGAGSLLVAPLSSSALGVVATTGSSTDGVLDFQGGKCLLVVDAKTDPAARVECHVLLEYVASTLAVLKALEVACAKHVTTTAAYDALEYRNPLQQRRVSRLAASRFALEACCDYVIGGLTEAGDVPLAEARLTHALSGALLATHAADCAMLLGAADAPRSHALAAAAQFAVDTASSGVAAVAKEVPTDAEVHVKPTAIGGLGVDVSLKHVVNPVAADTAALRATLVGIPAAARAVAAAPIVAELFGSACAAFLASSTNDHGLWLRAQIFNEHSSLRRKELLRVMRISGVSTGSTSDPLSFPMPKA